jgi:hypothetical protein
VAFGADEPAADAYVVMKEDGATNRFGIDANGMEKTRMEALNSSLLRCFSGSIDGRYRDTEPY